jgi:zinc finger HIT domain-containing protein 1
MSLLDDDEGGKTAKGRARQIISDKRTVDPVGGKKKKTTMNIRTAILYKKNLATIVEESVSVPCNHLSRLCFLSNQDILLSP